MTTVAWRHPNLAADSAIWDEQDYCAGLINKVGVMADGSLWAIAGKIKNLSHAMPWLQCPLGDPPEMAETTLIIVRTDGTVMDWDESGWVELLPGPFRAWGSGAMIALGAMHVGADAVAAVQAAAAFDAFTGGSVTVATLGSPDTAAPTEEDEPTFDFPGGDNFTPERPQPSWRDKLGL